MLNEQTLPIFFERVKRLVITWWKRNIRLGFLFSQEVQSPLAQTPYV